MTEVPRVKVTNVPKRSLQECLRKTVLGKNYFDSAKTRELPSHRDFSVLEFNVNKLLQATPLDLSMCYKKASKNIENPQINR